MRKIAKFVTVALAVCMLAGVMAVGASAEGETVKRVLFVNPGAAPAPTEATETEPAYREFTVNVDGEAETIKLLAQPGLRDGEPSFLDMPFFGVFNATINSDGYVEKLLIDPALTQGFLVNAPENGKIVLGVNDDEYAFAKDARVFLGSKDSPVETLEIKPEEIQDCWDAAYWLDLNEAGEISKMYIVVTMNLGLANETLTDNIKKFDFAVGPETDDGVSTRYNYYKPAAQDDVKYPLVIWFHGFGCGQYDWQSLFDFNPIATFASDAYQEQFTAGGAYVMTPLANELYDDVGERTTWYPSQVGGFYAALDDFIASNPDIDVDRIYVGGFSMGGGMTWLAIRERPDFFAAAFPNCPVASYVAQGDELHNFASLPLWLMHGVADPVVPVTATTDALPILLADAERTGTDTRVTILEEHFLMPDGVTQIPLDHLSWIATLNNMLFDDGEPYKDKDGVPVESTLIEWLNGQTRSANLARADEGAFTDVNADDWFYEYVMPLYKDGVINGVGDYKFAPSESVTLAQTLKLVLLAAGYDAQEPTGEHWASGYLDAAVTAGLLPAIDAESPEAAIAAYGLDEPVTRLEAAQLAAGALKLETTLTQSPFDDTDDAAVLALYEAGIVEGDGSGGYKPDASLTRSAMSKIVYLVQIAGQAE
ncbi:MAG: S-layer homology domain-containing protein [Oscillospiraceae bacterium]|jgi:poly(3-hydroxybutyrate) depolymerase|nr:S-layer homology domain-containing protein [Oscillospiraceae bacterium]